MDVTKFILVGQNEKLFFLSNLYSNRSVRPPVSYEHTNSFFFFLHFIKYATTQILLSPQEKDWTSEAINCLLLYLVVMLIKVRQWNTEGIFLFLWLTGKSIETPYHYLEGCPVQPPAVNTGVYVCRWGECVTGAATSISQDCWPLEGEGSGWGSTVHKAGRIGNTASPILGR